MRAPALLLLLALRTDAAPALKDACNLLPEALVPAIDSKGPSVEKIELAEGAGGEKHLLRQAVRLKSGVEVRFDMEACMSYAYAFTFRGFSPPASSKASDWIKLAYPLLKSAPLTAKGKEIADELLGALGAAMAAKSRMENGVIELPCGDARCRLSAKDPKSLILSYALAL